MRKGYATSFTAANAIIVPAERPSRPTEAPFARRVTPTEGRCALPFARGGPTDACALPAMLHAEWGDAIYRLDFSVHDQKSGDQRLSVDSFGEETHSAGFLDGMSFAGSRV